MAHLGQELSFVNFVPQPFERRLHSKQWTPTDVAHVPLPRILKTFGYAARERPGYIHVRPYSVFSRHKNDQTLVIVSQRRMRCEMGTCSNGAHLAILFTTVHTRVM